MVPIVVLWLISTLQSSNGEIYSSMHKLEVAFSTYKTEHNRIQLFLSKNEKINSEEVLIAHMKKTVEKIEINMAVEDLLRNPTCIFHWLWQTSQIRNLLKVSWLIAYFPNAHIALATIKDLKGAANGLLLLQWLYSISTRDVIEGRFEDIPGTMATPLSTEEIHFIAKTAFEKGFYKLEQSWLVEWMKERKNSKMVDFVTNNVYHKIDILIHIHKSNSDITFWAKLFNLCLLLNEENLAFRIAQTIQKLHGYHYSGFLSNKKSFLNNVEETCFDVTQLELKLDHLSVALDYESENVDGDMDYCLDDVDEFVDEEPIIRSGLCKWSVPSPFYTIGPLKEEVLSEDPEIKLWHKFFHENEMKTMLEHSHGAINRAEVEVKIDPKAPILVSDRRTSSSHFITHPDELYHRLDKRIEAASGLLVNNKSAEKFQINNYGIGGLFNFHHDARNDTFISPKMEDFKFKEMNRLATVMVYLSDVHKGGATIFPDIRTAVTPQKGTAVVWFNMYRSGWLHMKVRHAGCPVFSGSKWVVNKWIHYEKQHQTRPCKLHRDAI